MIDRTRRKWVATQILPHEAEVRGWLRRHLHSLRSHDIDDLIQETYARLLAADIASVANGRSYVFSVVRHLLHRQLRRARIVPMERLGEIDALRLPSDELSPERKVSARQELERLERIVYAMPTQARRAFQLQKFHGLTQRQIAEEMHISEKTVEKHLAVALSRVLAGFVEETSTGSAGGRQSEVSAHDQRSTD
ncbi:RNA polymerase sigma factor [Steroidobacter sp.]|uniref:RNA polymerase sigma factor n=1 Tax=Steroidobacter sp. TaxID=1978227 RepID=UPI001A4878CE|nr:RNA polymerase sigma factor [Steroidobacter sp.]MBL8272154.1 RNA polymerase sigma factor [Steroidobacter sp.]